jgi:hypothetical protein
VLPDQVCVFLSLITAIPRRTRQIAMPLFNARAPRDYPSNISRDHLALSSRRVQVDRASEPDETRTWSCREGTSKVPVVPARRCGKAKPVGYHISRTGTNEPPCRWSVWRTCCRPEPAASTIGRAIQSGERSAGDNSDAQRTGGADVSVTTSSRGWVQQCHQAPLRPPKRVGHVPSSPVGSKPR